MVPARQLATQPHCECSAATSGRWLPAGRHRWDQGNWNQGNPPLAFSRSRLPALRWYLWKLTHGLEDCGRQVEGGQGLSGRGGACGDLVLTLSFNCTACVTRESGRLPG